MERAIPPCASELQTATMDSNNAEATEYLTRLLNKTLRIHTTDSRIFVGTMKCTDQVRLASTDPLR